MDYIASTISHDQIDELFQFSSLPCQGAQVDELDEILLTTSTLNWNVLAGEELLGGAPPPPVAGPLAAPVAGGPVEQNPSESNKKRKIVHRNVERQRRQEMASLYRSLRSHLPIELLKGKRSISDHIHQAVGYIKNKQNKIQELCDKRDELKRMLESKNANSPEANREEHPLACCPLDIVKIESFIGVEITISTDSRQGTALSKVIGFLIQEGLNVVGCTSTRVNERLLHCIKSEVTGNSRSSTDNLSEMKKKLMSLSC